MIAYLAAIWRCRLFWLALTQLDIRKRYHRSLLGVGWAYVQPVLMTLMFCGIFSSAFQVHFLSHIPYTLIGIAFWGFISTVVIQGCGCLSWSETYIRQQRAPMAIYPLRIVLAAAFHLLVLVLLLQMASWAFHGLAGILVSFSVIVGLFLLLLFGWALATIVGFLNVYFPDVLSLCELALPLCFYATPLVYRPRLLEDRGLGFLVHWNPFAALVELIRTPILTGTLPPLPIWVGALSTVGLALMFAAVTLKILERRIIFVL
jgi:ABC-type polysaccharide/polyol phosphate export permease